MENYESKSDRNSLIGADSESDRNSLIGRLASPPPPIAIQCLIGIPSVSAGLLIGIWCLNNCHSWPKVIFVRGLRNHQEQGYAAIAFLGVTFCLMLIGLLIFQLARRLSR